MKYGSRPPRVVLGTPRFAPSTRCSRVPLVRFLTPNSTVLTGCGSPLRGHPHRPIAGGVPGSLDGRRPVSAATTPFGGGARSLSPDFSARPEQVQLGLEQSRGSRMPAAGTPRRRAVPGASRFREGAVRRVETTSRKPRGGEQGARSQTGSAPPDGSWGSNRYGEKTNLAQGHLSGICRR